MYSFAFKTNSIFTFDTVQFFENANASSSPRKKRKLEVSEDALSLSQDGYEEAMPNYHEDLEVDDEALKAHPLPTEEERSEARPPTSVAFTSRSGPSRSISLAEDSDKAGQSSSTLLSPSKRPRSHSQSPSAADDGNLQSQTCPVCSKTMQTDNQGLNAHVDFCLSKGAIREARAMASGSTHHQGKPSARLLKPPVKRAAK